MMMEAVERKTVKNVTLVWTVVLQGLSSFVFNQSKTAQAIVQGAAGTPAPRQPDEHLPLLDLN